MDSVGELSRPRNWRPPCFNIDSADFVAYQVRAQQRSTVLLLIRSYELGLRQDVAGHCAQ